MLESGLATGVVLLVIMASSAMGWIITFEQLPAAFAEFAKNTLQDPWLIILAMNLIMLVAGMFIDLPAAVLLLTPIFVPLAAMAGMDTVQLGVMMVVNLAIGLYTRRWARRCSSRVRSPRSRSARRCARWAPFIWWRSSCSC